MLSREQLRKQQKSWEENKGKCKAKTKPKHNPNKEVWRLDVFFPCGYSQHRENENFNLDLGVLSLTLSTNKDGAALMNQNA